MNGKRARFCEEYLLDLNATQAAIRAGYSKKTAYSQGQRLLKDVEVAAKIEELQEARSERTQITADQVVRELAKVGFSNMANYADWGPDGVELVAAGDLTPDQSAVVSEVSETVSEKSRSLRFKLHNKVDALEKIGRHLGMFKDVMEVKGEVPVLVVRRETE
jgi:phage terminase small subunit